MQPSAIKEEVSPEKDDKKYLELIDLLTNKMFDTESGGVAGTKQKKSNSLPRSGAVLPEARLRKSSSQVFSPVHKAGPRPPGQLSAYERLFGVPSPSSSRCSSPGIRKVGGPAAIIPKAKRSSSGSAERPSVLGRLGGAAPRAVSDSKENVSYQLLNACITNPSSEEKRKERISMSSIDGLFSAPQKIDIPARYKPEQVGEKPLADCKPSGRPGRPCPSPSNGVGWPRPA
jgi:hypothetical protein